MLEYPELTIKETNDLPKGLPGFNKGFQIFLSKQESLYRKHFLLAEEIGHYETTAGDITDLDTIAKLKAEVVARRWGYEKIISLDDLVSCFEKNHLTAEDVAHDFEIELDALKIILDHYFDKYGPSVQHRGYIINFDPFIAINLKTLEGGEYL
ncbi:hypothetical protein JMA_22600 [Jeotgalibacillus malaysiensis]|uniref:IrrE N-terminal-like domain-containing protein n=1 Tax=Jeotgalibacillus malaysiensis TaxID=1508404 RepID=A0A0B5ASB5_9BACL|nr:ImmA/IrrE family metallo-endopeptidase [Jeotgalibacillus malaysiensis]AJD91577.1 hypothetical protein JMA_22600 [Jeotgalibacillus malaysiensis]